jgi:hypothetical protein
MVTARGLDDNLTRKWLETTLTEVFDSPVARPFCRTRTTSLDDRHLDQHSYQMQNKKRRYIKFNGRIFVTNNHSKHLTLLQG